ncbi:C39 family peptidase [Candidatus Chazhemtobacterium aquaticus]|uniref:Peptidase family C39 n=1 Tax=Candidatus Chazhemtobacterium aquaticus TaxID=2715735 RepID=A0A857NBX8_9BACT|nr:C39 family peptidase [Candidatus Chazhemtobacterium aquaticus]QHO63412.1 Peptidase family C39 [Candidatus Chazhemtobacterium aquaticus]
MKKVFLSLFIVVYLALSHHSVTTAIDCDGNLPDDEAQLKEYIAACETKVSELRTEKQSLTAAISLLNSKINLTQAQIRNTNAQISQLTEEIGTLSVVIDDLNNELDALTKVYLSRVREAYKNRHTNIALSLLSDSEQNFQSRLKYLETTHKRDQIIMHELESARINFDQQKTTKEEKQAEIESLKTTLESQKQVLGAQESQKQQLLTETQNNEKRYQQMLSDAQRQLAAFRRFVTDQGGASILSNQTSCDSWGCYYNQRDSQWGNQLIGLSSDSTMKEYGCLVTSMAIIASHYGKSLTPGQIAASSDPFWLNTAYMRQGQWTVNGVTMNRTRLGSSRSLIDSELESNRPVVVGIYGGPDHFIVIKSKVDGEYIMNDPFIENGKDVKFTDKYPLEAISAVDRVVVN